MNWRLATGAAMAALTSPALAQNGPQVAAVQVDPDRPDWENPAVNARGTRPASASVRLS
jgi:beta-galactosidase